MAEKALFRIRKLQSDISEIQTRLGGEGLGVSWSWKMEEAKLRWARGEQDTAMYLLKSLGRHLEKVFFFCYIQGGSDAQNNPQTEPHSILDTERIFTAHQTECDSRHFEGGSHFAPATFFMVHFISHY